MDKQTVDRVIRQVIGMRLQEAKGLIIGSGLIYRITSTDGIQFAGTADYVPYRINLDVIDDVVRESRIG